MPKELFLASDFVATKFSTAADKANFGNLLLHFIDSGWKQKIHTEKFYSRLSMSFGHIAHYVERAIMQSSLGKAAWAPHSGSVALRIKSSWHMRQFRW
jgi:hypothetical protein